MSITPPQPIIHAVPAHSMITPSLTAGWKADQSFGGFRIYTIGPHVMFQGVLRLTTGQWDGKGISLICTLPESVRPRTDLVFPSAAHKSEVYVRANGNLEIHGGNSVWTRWDYVPLNMIQYWTN